MKNRTKQWLQSKKRGITLLETLLALAVGAVVIVASIQGVNRYTQGVQVQASSSQLQRLTQAMDTWSNDNFEIILADAPRVYTPAETRLALTDYLGSSFPQDAFRNDYRIASRTYTYTVPDPANGGVPINRDAFQLLLIGFNTDPGPIATETDIRINIANTAGTRAGFISTAIASCPDGVGGTLPAGNICGAFGSYALEAAQFPANALDDAFVVSLVTKGDSSFYGDQLYRYDYNDPDLNTMRTTLIMDSATNPNEIQSPRRAVAMRSQTVAGGEASVTVGSEAAGLEGSVQIAPGLSNVTQFIGQGADPTLRSDTTVLQIGAGAERVRLGDIVAQSLTRADGSVSPVLEMGTGALAGDAIFSNVVNASAINSLYAERQAPLRLQDFSRGEVIVGQRARYQTAANGVLTGQTYELSDGRLIAGHMVAQDITCADCGGSLSEILPRWRHMGTYFINYTSSSGTSVPKPACTFNRRDTLNRAATSEETNFSESANDNRYAPAILLIPRQMRSKGFDDGIVNPGSGQAINGGTRVSDVPFDSHLRAVNASPTAWTVRTDKPTDNIFTTAFAMTYCVFQGGSTDQVDPTNTSVPGMYAAIPTGHGAWTPLP